MGILTYFTVYLRKSDAKKPPDLNRGVWREDGAPLKL